MQVGEGSAHVFQADGPADQGGQVQFAVAVQLQQFGDVGGGVAAAVHAPLQGAGEVRDLQRVEGQLVGGRAEAHHGGGAAAAGARPGDADGGGPAHALHGVVDAASVGELADPPGQVVAGGEEGRRAQGAGQLILLLYGGVRADRVDARDVRALDRW